MIKLYRVYSSGMVNLEYEDNDIGQIYAAPNRCDVCQEPGKPVLEISFLSQDVCICPGCLRVLADAVEDFQDRE